MRILGWRSASPTTENGNGNTSDRRELEVDPGWWLPFRPKSSRATARSGADGLPSAARQTSSFGKAPFLKPSTNTRSHCCMRYSTRVFSLAKPGDAKDFHDAKGTDGKSNIPSKVPRLRVAYFSSLLKALGSFTKARIGMGSCCIIFQNIKGLI